MEKYILKVCGGYIIDGNNRLGLPPRAEDFADARVFNEDELDGFLTTICLRPEIIKI